MINIVMSNLERKGINLNKVPALQPFNGALREGKPAAKPRRARKAKVTYKEKSDG